MHAYIHTHAQDARKSLKELALQWSAEFDVHHTHHHSTYLMEWLLLAQCLFCLCDAAIHTPQQSHLDHHPHI